MAATFLASCSFLKRRSRPRCVLDVVDAGTVLVLRGLQPTSRSEDHFGLFSETLGRQTGDLLEGLEESGCTAGHWMGS